MTRLYRKSLLAILGIGSCAMLSYVCVISPIAWKQRYGNNIENEVVKKCLRSIREESSDLSLEHQVCCMVCPLRPYDGVNHTLVTVNYTEPSVEELSRRHPELSPGGRWSPRDCIPRHRLAIIIPYRDREKNLKLFLQHIHPFLQGQFIEYGIYVAEQKNDKQFNRGLSRNVGFVEAMKLDSFDCVIFHDVDLLPIDLRNMYSCSESPRHFCIAADYIGNYTYLGKKSPFGGVVGMRTEHFQAANGYSNRYFGWGGEDDDLGNRLNLLNHTISRFPLDIGKYNGLSHLKSADINKHRFTQLHGVAATMQDDGLSSLNFTSLNVTRLPLYTYIQFDYDKYEYRVPPTVPIVWEVEGTSFHKIWMKNIQQMIKDGLITDF